MKYILAALGLAMSSNAMANSGYWVPEDFVNRSLTVRHYAGFAGVVTIWYVARYVLHKANKGPGSTSTGARVLAVKADLAKIVLLQPVCVEEGEKIALSRRVEKHWRYECCYLVLNT